MKPALRFVLLMCIVSIITLIPNAVTHTSAATTKAPLLGNYDIRVFGGDEMATLLSTYAPTGKLNTAQLAGAQAAMLQGVVRLKGTVPDADVRFSQLFGAAEVVRSNKGTLTPSTPGRDAATIAKDFLRTNQAVYGLNSAEVGALHFLGESRSPANGLRMVRFEQQVQGLPVFQSDTRFIVTADGRLVRSVGLLVPSLTAAAAPLGQQITPAAALASAMASVGITLNPDAAQMMYASGDGATADLDARHPAITDAVVSKLVYFPLAPGLVIPAWSQVTFTSGEGDWYTLVDARTGTLLWRKNIRSSPIIAPEHTSGGATAAPVATAAVVAPTVQRQPRQNAQPQPPAPQAVTQDARFSVYVQADGSTPSSPAPHNPTTVTPGSGTQFPAISRTTVSMLNVQDLTASPNGWIPDDGTTTTGNNVDAYLDIDVAGAGSNVPDNRLDATGRPTGNPDSNGRNRDFLGTAPRDYSYTPAPLVNNPDAGDAPSSDNFRRGVVTQLFYVTNWYHDQLYQLGFDEAAGNFQHDTFGRGGVGNDRILAEAQDGSGLNNANFSTPPDGQSGRMQMYLFTGPNPDRDGSLDAEIVLHELTHGLSNRLIGNSNGLIWDVGGSMGEGWSDFYALSLLYSNPGNHPDAAYSTGGYATYKLTSTYTDNYLYGIRRFPLSTDNTVNPLTWADIDDTTLDLSGGIPTNPIDFSASGGLEVHAAGELWTLTLWEVRSRIIADPAGANGNVPIGNQTMLQLTTDAMKLTPINPSFLDARDALLDADCATNACANERWIWEGFADRGLGYGAVAPLSQGGVIGYAGQMGVNESFAVPALDVANVTINDSRSNANSAIDPGELISLTINLKNPWHNQAVTANNVQATLSSITPGVTVLNPATSYGTLTAQSTSSGTFSFTLDPGANCGDALRFTLQISSSLGTVSRDITLRIGQASGTSTPVVYTRTIPGGLAIPDNSGRGVTDNLTISDDFEIADLDFRVDSLTHTWTSDVGLMLKAPNGYGTNLIYYRGIFYNNNSVRSIDFIDTIIDDEATADLNQALPSDQPFTGRWKPAFNSPFWSEFGIPNLGPDPVGQLSRLDGTSTQGVWKVHVNDIFLMDQGKLNAWSLIVTPTAFSCTSFTPGANVVGTKSVAGSTTAGSTITYTVILTNTGSAAQADNAGDEFTDVLPAQLTLLGANASAGTAIANVGARTVTWNGAIPINGAVKLTITAQVNAGTNGATVSNQGTIAFDSDNNGSNDATALTDNPATAAANDATSFVVSALGVPNIKATQVAALTTDRNGDGKVNPGDTLSYTVVVSNVGTASGQGIVFTSGLDANTTLVVGSVTTSQSSVTSGNSVGDTTATVALGTLAQGSSATITFRATVQSSLLPSVTQVASQGTVTGSNIAQLRTDDPSTPAANDATVTLIHYLMSLYLSFIGR